MLQEQEFVFIWDLYEEADIFKSNIFRCNNNRLFISVTGKSKLKKNWIT